MAYDIKTEATIVIGRPYHTMLTEIAASEKRKLKDTLELLIEQKHKEVSKNTNKTS